MLHMILTAMQMKGGKLLGNTLLTDWVRVLVSTTSTSTSMCTNAPASKTNK